MRRLNRAIEDLKREQDEVIRLKTGFFRGVSKKQRDQREAVVSQRLLEKQNELEAAMLKYSSAKDELLVDYEGKSRPVLERMKGMRKRVGELETDGSLEDRWFACEALIDAVNSFLQRKALEKV